jgi:hypothetical protein
MLGAERTACRDGRRPARERWSGSEVKEEESMNNALSGKQVADLIATELYNRLAKYPKPPTYDMQVLGTTAQVSTGVFPFQTTWLTFTLEELSKTLNSEIDKLAEAISVLSSGYTPLFLSPPPLPSCTDIKEHGEFQGVNLRFITAYDPARDMMIGRIDAKIIATMWASKLG